MYGAYGLYPVLNDYQKWTPDPIRPQSDFFYDFHGILRRVTLGYSFWAGHRFDLDISIFRFCYIGARKMF